MCNFDYHLNREDKRGKKLFDFFQLLENLFKVVRKHSGKHCVYS